jgi:GAF domain-containing protein
VSNLPPDTHAGTATNGFESELLRICHVSPDLESLMKGLVAPFSRASGCEAIGIRLHRGVDFPYYTTAGFSDDFVQAETSLCVRDAGGQPQLDDAGNPVLACMCGNIIRGRFDPERPFFTAHGSFWTNSTSQLLATTTEADRQARTRNRCNGEGFESVALVPLRTCGHTFGLVQFNDRRPGCFDAGTIADLERLVDYVSIALAKFEAEEALKRSEEKYRQLTAELQDALAHVKTLRGFIPICSACKKIRDDTGYWQAVDVYVRDHTEAEFTHGLCPDCARRLYPGLAESD